jgi:hypothetical protein
MGEYDLNMLGFYALRGLDSLIKRLYGRGLWGIRRRWIQWFVVVTSQTSIHTDVQWTYILQAGPVPSLLTYPEASSIDSTLPSGIEVTVCLERMHGITGLRCPSGDPLR